MDAMREMLLALEHLQENPIEVEDGSEGEMVVSNGVEVAVEENEVAIPIPPPGHLVLIEDVVQELPDELVGTQIAFDLAKEDCHQGRPLVGFPWFSLQPKRPCVSLSGMVPAGLKPSTGLLGLVGHLGVVSWSKG